MIMRLFRPSLTTISTYDEYISISVKVLNHGTIKYYQNEYN